MFLSRKKLTVTAPAKVNLHLKVLDKRLDGFHNIDSIFLAVDFADVLRFELVEREKTAEITMKGLDLGLPVEKNIIFHALNLFRERTGLENGVSIIAEKRIPPGGGLGGGSSNAAAALLALNELTGFPLSRPALLETAAALGSDVPFFIHLTAAARVTGRGEIIEPLKPPRLFFVLVNPGFPSATAAAFRLLDEHKTQGHEETRSYTKEGLEKMLTDNPARWSFKNDFLPVFGERERTLYDEIIRKLREYGACFAGLSGAGSTCFGVFLESAPAQRAALTLRREWNFAEYCSTLF